MSSAERPSDDESIIEKILSSLSLSDKVGLMSNSAAAVPHAGLEKYQWWSEALHGVASSPGISFKNHTPFATSFPQVISTAASFNASLFEMIGTVVGDEARAFINDGGAQGRTFWTPNINIFRDPRWGRGQETPGEDPLLTSVYATGFVKGLQDERVVGGGGRRRLKAAACCKHLFDYNLEAADGVTRFSFDAQPAKQDELDTYLPAFEACVARAKAAGLMCSYNAVRGVPSCANKWLIQHTARAAWGFRGYVTGDCGAVQSILDDHKYAKTPGEAVRVALEAGTDLDCGSFYAKHLPQAVASGEVKMELVDKALRRLLRVQLWAGALDSRFYPEAPDPFKDIRYSTHGPDNTRHQQLALEASQQAIVLLENEEGMLPLTPSPAWCKAPFVLALVGPHAEATQALLGNYHGVPPYTISPLRGLLTLLSSLLPCAVRVHAAPGCSSVSLCAPDDVAAAAALAARASVLILLPGLDQSIEAESLDRTALDLPPQQLAMLSAVAAALPPSARAVTVLLSGGPVDLSAVPPVLRRSLLWAGYGGQSGGQAVAAALLGVRAPSGRVPVSWYPAGFARASQMTENRMRAWRAIRAQTEEEEEEERGEEEEEGTCSPGRTYRFYDSTACRGRLNLGLLYEFGYGLSSYGQAWAYSALTVTWSSSTPRALLVQLHVTPPPSASASAAAAASASSSLSLGAATHSVLLFAVPPPGKVQGQPLKLLLAFASASAGAASAAAPLLSVHFDPLDPALRLRLAADGPGATGRWVAPDFAAEAWTLQAGCIPHTPPEECARALIPAPPSQLEGSQTESQSSHSASLSSESPATPGPTGSPRPSLPVGPGAHDPHAAPRVAL